MVIPYRRPGIAGCASKPGFGFLRLAASAIAVTAAIASSPAMADGKNRVGRNKLANLGPVVPQITAGVGNSSKQTDIVVVSIPAATSKTIGNSGPGLIVLPVSAVASSASVKSGGAAGNHTGAPLITSANGRVWLAAGQSVEIADPESPDLRVVVKAPRHQSLDIGKIVANTGRSGIYATLAARAGPPRANGVSLASDGRVMLTSNRNHATRGQGYKSHDWHRPAIGRKRSHDSLAAGPAVEDGDLNVNATSVQAEASQAVKQQTNADRDATLKTGDPVIVNTARGVSHYSKSGVCS